MATLVCHFAYYSFRKINERPMAGSRGQKMLSFIQSGLSFLFHENQRVVSGNRNLKLLCPLTIANRRKYLLSSACVDMFIPWT